MAIGRARTSTKYDSFFSLIVGVLFLMVMAPIYIYGYFHTERTLPKFAQELQSIQPPNGTHILATTTHLGTVQGNGDHCDYLTGVLFDTQDSKEDVVNYYKSNYKGESEPTFIWLDEDNDYTTTGRSFIAIGPLKEMADMHPSSLLRGIVYIYKPEATYDIRCAF